LEVAAALRRKAAEMASAAAAAQCFSSYSSSPATRFLRQRGGARVLQLSSRRSFCVSAAAGGFDNQNREWVPLFLSNPLCIVLVLRKACGFEVGELCTVNGAYELAGGSPDCRYVIVGGGNAAGYAARTFVEHGMADGRLCIVSKEVLLCG
jgi:monodehydroascorbate reductase (NADH)